MAMGAKSVHTFLNYIDKVLIHQENGYLELQLQKIKEKRHALDVMVNLSMGLDPYSNLNINKQTTYVALKNLENGGFIKKIEKAKYVICDPLLALYLNH